MKPRLCHLPTVATVAAAAALVAYGPIAQFADYHDFADRSLWFGVPHAGDVLSNAGFAVVALWGWLCLFPRREDAALRAGWAGWRLFLAGLLLTALGSGYYHLAPDNARLLWDRLPIALACAGLLLAVRGECRPPAAGDRVFAAAVVVFAVASVFWWQATDALGMGDLRPYVLLQGLPLLLVPLWQAIYGVPRPDRAAFAVAIGLYVLAKVAELNDHEIHTLLGGISGHTVKHLLATAAAAVIVGRLVGRGREPVHQ